MGWFSSALQGIGSCVNWVKQNTGTIGQAASIVAQVAGAVALEGEEDPTAAIFPNFTAASAKVAAVAQNGAQEHLEKIMNSLPDHIKSEPTLEVAAPGTPAETTFLWHDPAPLDAKGDPNRGLARDLSKMLAQRSFPTVLPLTGTTDLSAVGFDWIDVAKTMGQAIFGNLGQVETSQDGLIQSTRFSIPSGDGSCVITGCHAYYGIPLGQTGTNTAWHAGLVMHKITTGSYRALEATHRKRVSLTKPIAQSGSEPQWLCTMAVQWEDSVSASVIAPRLVQQISANKEGYTLNTCSLDGMMQQLKIQCPPDATPTQAKGLVRQCVKDALAGVVGFVGPQAAGATSGPYLTPDIQLTMSTLLLPNAHASRDSR